ncbi:hypothetical protein HDR59_04805 [bacterium]|nr:hypothetical protein [bacterium]
MLKTLLTFLFLSISSITYSQEIMDMDSYEDDVEFIGEDGEIEEYEDYVEEGEEDYIVSDTNERVKYFDIAGVMLEMDYKKVRKVLKERKYKLTDIEYKIPEYFSFNYDSICRKHDILIPENLKACITGLAKKDKMQYIYRASFKKHDTNEDINVYFTSPITDNKVYKIEYTNDVNKKYGDSLNFKYQREERRRAFWYFVLSKYGKPNVEPNQWLLNVEEEAPTGLTATYGKLVLENKKQNAFDILEANNEARRQFKYTDYTF